MFPFSNHGENNLENLSQLFKIPFGNKIHGQHSGRIVCSLIRLITNVRFSQLACFIKRVDWHIQCDVATTTLIFDLTTPMKSIS